jgi:hypothetical protein
MAGCGQVTCSLGGNCYSLQGETVVDGIGCGEGDVCSDGECVGLESADLCPTDPEKEEPGVCGCGATDEDSDADQTPDCQDECPQDEAKTEAGECGCGAAEPNGLGITVCGDSCPEDVDKIEPGVCGCGTADTDTDADLVADCNDGCPQNPNKVAPDANGCEDAPALGAGGALSGVGGSLVGVGGMSGVGGSPAGGLPGAGGTLSAGAAGPGGAMAAESGGGCSLATRPATGSRSGAMALAMLVSLGWSSRRRRRLQPFASR